MGLLLRNLSQFSGAKVDNVGGGNGFRRMRLVSGPLHDLHVGGTGACITGVAFGGDGLLVERGECIGGVDERLAESVTRGVVHVCGIHGACGWLGRDSWMKERLDGEWLRTVDGLVGE